ncbi:MAG: type II toxin-antitoxin system RelE/ParE family toxin [Bacteroidetes bacterium]|nr:type II toxin-antitoxin system RelE/ParE family toxin [Bacteroidota bacterium]MBK9671143.1 type II toxin-antitoxin system RelE/ParE family toxin [Bacteroidota bacterium]MBK9798811.1 type II toxin-antitoxin system RelE/ParE family toxin [Bacteroidota bacterium]MBP6412249.1 type II toxin-antitoxin system RelE/ParE family toxin [Bacteroidia bacterium]
MIVEFDKSFEKSIDRLKDKTLFPKIEKFIASLESVKALSELSNVKKLSGFKTYYRFRLGDYRIGFEKLNENTVRLIIICRRKDIYKVFP